MSNRKMAVEIIGPHEMECASDLERDWNHLNGRFYDLLTLHMGEQTSDCIERPYHCVLLKYEIIKIFNDSINLPLEDKNGLNKIVK